MSISRVSDRLRHQLQEEPDVETIAAELAVPVQEIWDALRYARTAQSLDEPFE